MPSSNSLGAQPLQLRLQGLHLRHGQLPEGWPLRFPVDALLQDHFEMWRLLGVFNISLGVNSTSLELPTTSSLMGCVGKWAFHSTAAPPSWSTQMKLQTQTHPAYGGQPYIATSWKLSWELFVRRFNSGSTVHQPGNQHSCTPETTRYAAGHGCST